MNRKQFIKKLRRNLKFLDKKNLEEEIYVFTKQLNKSKKSEEETIKSFGSIKDIVKEICNNRNLDYNKVSKYHFFKGYYNDFVDLINIFKNNNGKTRFKIITDLLLLIVVTCILKIPFIFIRDMGDKSIDIFFKNDVKLLTVWGVLIEIIYIIVALSFFLKTFKKWFRNIKLGN